MGSLIELLNMAGWPEIVEVPIEYSVNEKMVFQFGDIEITSIIEEIQDGIDTIGTGLERRVRKQEDMFIPNKPCVEDTIWLRLGRDYAYWI